MDRLFLIQVEFLDRMLDLYAERHLPIGRDPVGTEIASQLPLAAGLFPSNDAEPRRLNTQFFQGSPVTAGRSASVPVRTFTASPLGSVARQVMQDADPQRRRDLPPDHVGVR